MLKLSIAKKLYLGFGIQVAILAVVAVVMMVKIDRVNGKTDVVLNQLVPSVHYSLAMQGEIHNALSMHRGYMILGLESLAHARIEAWEKIDGHIAALDKLSLNWNNQSTVQAFSELKNVMKDFRVAQDEIARLAHTDDDIPAKKVFFEQAMPHGEQMVKHLNAILDKEQHEEATAERKLLVRRISDAKGHLLMASQAITACLVSGDRASLERVQKEVASCQASVDRLMTKTEWLTPDQKIDFDQYIAERKIFLEKAFAAVEMRSADDWCQSEHICLNQVAPLAGRADELLATIIDNQKEEENQEQAALAEIGQAARVAVIGAALFGIALGVFLAFTLGRLITRPLNLLLDRIKDIAEGEGDLTQRMQVNSKDEVGQVAHWFNVFIAKIHDVVAEVTKVTSDVAEASSEIAISAEEIAQGMGDQSGQINLVSAAVEEMSSSVVEVARKSADASDSANESGRVASEGGQVVTETITGMKSINHAVTSSATSVEELGKRGEQIGEVITVINDIADQTNLLALNAAIEAARAGEHGRGFAVVADEVRKLADRTTSATQEISESIQAIQSETTTAVEKMNSGTKEVATGVARAEQAGEALKQIVASAQDVSSMVQSIAAAAEQQSVASDEVGRNIVQISTVTEQTAAGTSEAAKAAHQLSERAERLKGLVGQFKTDQS